MHVLKDMLWAYVLEFGSKLDQFLPLAEFSYYNSYHSIIQMALFEAWNGRCCHTPIGWFDSTEPRLYGTNFLQEALSHVCAIQDRLRMAKSWHQSYPDRRLRPLYFDIGYQVFLWVSSLKEGDEIWWEE